MHQQSNIKKLSKELDELLLREEMMWRQRSRVKELKEGDRNTKYFQRKATWRKKKNTITKLRDDLGNWVEDRKGIEDLATRFFKNLYTSDPGVVPFELIELHKNLSGRI